MRKLCLQVRQVLLSEPELGEELQDFIGASEDSILAFEGRLPEESFADGWAFVAPSPPLAVGHRDLVQVREQRVHPVELDGGRLEARLLLTWLCGGLRLHNSRLFFWMSGK